MATVNTLLATPRGGFAKALKALYDWLEALSPASFLASVETITHAGSGTETINLNKYHTKFVSNGAAKAAAIGDGTGAVVGQRKLITLQTRVGGSDTIVLDHANMLNAAGSAASSCILDAANEFILLEWRGSKWQTMVASAGVIS